MSRLREVAGRLARRPFLSLGAALLVLGGGFWGWFAWWTHVGHVRETYRLEWSIPLHDGGRTQAAQWISPPDLPLIGYYRKEFKAPGKIRSAWVQISAPFTFSFYINGRPIGGAFYKSARATGLYDITRHVLPGRNVIAVANTSRTYDETSRIVVAGAITDWQGHVTPIRSDHAWRTLDRYSRQIERSGKPPWYHPAYEAAEWPLATARGAPEPDDVARSAYPPRVLRDPVPTGWVWDQDPASTEVFFRRAIEADGKIRDAWLRVAARHSYSLFVNGYPIETEERGVVESPLMTPFDIYDITPYLGRGRNVVAIKVRRGALDHGLLADGFWIDDEGTHEIRTRSGHWRVSAAYHRGWVEPGFDHSDWRTAAPLRTDTPAAAVTFVKFLREIEPPRAWTYLHMLQLLLTELLGAALFVGIVFGGARWLRVGQADPLPALAVGGIAAVASSLLLGGVWLLGYDYRFDPGFSFRPLWLWTAFVIFLVSTLGLMAAPRWSGTGARRAARLHPPWATAREVVWRHRHLILLGLILALGLLVRIDHLAFEPIGADEIKMLEKSKGILTLGVPHVIVAQELGVRLSVTSELVHYPMAWSILIFGENELALRLPGVIFSMLTILLLYRYGQMLHSRGAGLLAATIYAFLPSVIRMSQLARYPAQLTFFTLLTIYLFWRCLQQRDIANRYLYLMTASYIVTYLSWEGAGFLIPSMFVALVISRPRDLGRTLATPRLVGCLFFVALLILLQLNIRAIVAGDLFIYGTGTSELTLVPTWNHSNFNALFYLDNFFLIENHQVMSWLFLAGLPLAFLARPWARGLRYLYAISIMNLFMKTCFLQIRNWRYTYNLLPILCLIAAVTLFVLLRALYRIAARAGALSSGAQILRRGVATAAVGLLILSSTAFFLKLYELPGSHGLPRTRLEDRYYPTIQEAVTFMDRHLRDDDVIITPVPHLVDFYIRDADYFLETILHFQVFLNPAYDTTMHRVSGTQAILTFEDLQKVLAQNRRVWFVTSPLDEKLLDDETQEWIDANMKVVYENIASLVYLAEN